MKTTCQKHEAFDFKEDGEHEFAGKYTRKLDNPNPQDKYTYLQTFAQGTQIPSKENNIVTCVDVDTINSDGHGDGAISHNCMDTEENSSTKSVPEVDDNKQSSSPVSEDDPLASPKRHASPGNCISNCVIRESSSRDEAIDMVSDADQSITETSPSTCSDIADDDDVFGGTTLDHFGDWEMEDDRTTIILDSDYMVYQDRYYTDSLVTFSSSYIEMKGSTAYGEEETFEIQWAVDEIIRIESQCLKQMDMAVVKMVVLSKDVGQAERDTLSIEELMFVVKSNWYQKQAAVISLNVKYKALWSSMLNTDMDKSRLEDELGQKIPKYLPRANSKISSKVSEFKRDLHLIAPVQQTEESNRNFDKCNNQLQHVVKFSFDDQFEEVIYPKGDADAVSISKRDVDLLRPEVFVNDTVIDFYIKYLKNKIQPEERHRFHFFNSFFFRKLADPDKDSFNASEGRAAFQRVRKWTRKVNLFEKDYVIIPVNFNYHWSLIVMCHLGEVAAFEDENVKESIRVPCILHMDSIKGSHAGLQDIVRSYLCEEWKEKRKEACDIYSRFYNLRYVSLELPQQQNSYDCGLFLLHYVELFLEQAPLNFNPFKITKSSKFLNANWFQPEEASLKRVVIQRLIYNLLEDHSRETTPVTDNDVQFSYSCQKSIFTEGCAVKFLSEKCSPLKNQRGNLLSSQTEQGIEIPLLSPTSLKGSSQCANGPFPGIFDHGLLDAQYSALSPTPHFNGFKPSVSSMTPIEEEVDTGEHFVYSPSTENGIRQLSGVAPEVSSFPGPSQDFKTNTSWDAGVSGHQAGDDNIVSPPKSSFPFFDFVAREVNEKTSQVASTDLGFKDNPGQPSSPLTEMITEPVKMVNGNDDGLENLTGLSSHCSDMQRKREEGLESLGLEFDVEHANKKRRLTPAIEGGDN